MTCLISMLGLLFFSDTICGVWHVQGIQLKNYLVLLNSLDTFQEEITILKAAWFKIDKKS